MNELISIIINVYNGEKYIKKCIDSVINQTYKNLEILIINDGSTDNTLKICKNYKDKRIKVITTKNQGLSLSRNKGIESAKGNYLYFVDADDFIENDTIEYLYNLSKKYNSNFVTSKNLTVFDYDFKNITVPEKIDILDSKEMLKKIIMMDNMSVTMWNKLLKKDLFDGIRFQNRIINDVVVTYKLAMKCNNIVYSNQIKYYYLKHSNAITVNDYGKRLYRSKDLYNAMFERYNEIKKVYPNFIENDISLIRAIIQLYSLDNKEVNKFLKEKKAQSKINKLFSYKMLLAKIKFKEKIKLVLFRISPKLFLKLSKKYRKKYKYKM